MHPEGSVLFCPLFKTVDKYSCGTSCRHKYRDPPSSGGLESRISRGTDASALLRVSVLHRVCTWNPRGSILWISLPDLESLFPPPRIPQRQSEREYSAPYTVSEAVRFWFPTATFLPCTLLLTIFLQVNFF